MRLLLATRSTDKAREIREILAPLAGLELLTLDDLQIRPTPDEDAIEAYDTFLDNATAKARHFAARTGLPTLADDSGLRVHALRGEPGVRSRRFSGRTDLAGRDLDRANNTLLLERLRDVPGPLRTARYVCAATLAHPDGTLLAALGTCDGRIADAPRGDAGFGYDPLFLLPDLDKTFAELTPAAKHRRSHRGRAFRALATLLHSPHAHEPGPRPTPGPTLPSPTEPHAADRSADRQG